MTASASSLRFLGISLRRRLAEDELIHRKLAGHFFGKPDECKSVTVAGLQDVVQRGGIIRPASMPQLFVILQGEGQLLAPSAFRDLERLAREVPARARAVYPKIAFGTLEIELVAAQVNRH